MRFRVALGIAVATTVVIWCPASASADRPRPDPNVAGLQTALALKGFYRGPIDGIRGPLTTAALRAFRSHFQLASVSLANVRTLAALGKLGRPRYATRTLHRGLVGLDVAALQFELRYHGFAVRGRGVFDAKTEIALKRFQRYAGLPPDGVAGRATYDALRAPPPLAPKLQMPVTPISRAAKTGYAVEIISSYGTAVAAATGGTVVFAGNRSRGYGYTVVTRDRRGFELLYAHLARVDVRVGQGIVPGALVGLVGWTGKRTPVASLRLELRLRGAQLDTYSALFRR